MDAERAREVVRQEMATSEDASNGVVACVFDGDKEVQAVEEAEVEHVIEARRSQRISRNASPKYEESVFPNVLHVMSTYELCQLLMIRVQQMSQCEDIYVSRM